MLLVSIALTLYSLLRRHALKRDLERVYFSAGSQSVRSHLGEKTYDVNTSVRQGYFLCAKCGGEDGHDERRPMRYRGACGVKGCKNMKPHSRVEALVKHLRQ